MSAVEVDYNYVGFPYTSNISPIIRKALDEKSVKRNRPISPFVRMVSGIHVDGKRMVMQGMQNETGVDTNADVAIDSLTKLYKPENSFRHRAGIQSVTVSYKNPMGSIRSATINWVCTSLTELELLSMYFLHPGKTLLLEWGWNTKIMLDKKGGLDNIIKNFNAVNIFNHFTQRNSAVLDSHGNYDSMIGIITGYNFSFQPDGSYKCQTTLLSSGILLEGINIPIQKATKPDKNGKMKPLTPLSSVLNFSFYKILKDLYKKYETPSEDSDYLIYSNEGETTLDTMDKKLNNVEIIFERQKSDPTAGAAGYGFEDEFIEDDPELKGHRKTVKQTPIEYSSEHPMYVSWGLVEDFIISPCVSIINGDDDKKELIAYNSAGIKIGNHKDLRTGDLRVCIVPQYNTEHKGTKLALDDFKFRGKDSEHSNSPNFGYVRKLMINTEYLRNTMLASINLNDAIVKLFSGISGACGNFWDFRFVTREVDYENDWSHKLGGKKSLVKYMVVDCNFSGKLIEYSDCYVMRSRSYGGEKNITSALNSLSMASKLSESFKLSSFYASHREDGTIMGKENTEAYIMLYKLKKKDFEKDQSDTFGGGRLYDKSAEKAQMAKNTSDADDVTLSDVDNGFNGSQLIQDQKSFPDVLKKYLPLQTFGYNKPVTDLKGNLRKLSGRQGMKMAVLMNEGDAVADPRNTSLKSSSAICPLETTLTIEGISGLRIGDIFIIDALPHIYLKNGFMQIINITEEITKDNWKTIIKAGFRNYIGDQKGVMNGDLDKRTGTPEPIKKEKKEKPKKLEKRGSIVKELIQLASNIAQDAADKVYENIGNDIGDVGVEKKYTIKRGIYENYPPNKNTIEHPEDNSETIQTTVNTIQNRYYNEGTLNDNTNLGNNQNANGRNVMQYCALTAWYWYSVSSYICKCDNKVPKTPGSQEMYRRALSINKDAIIICRNDGIDKIKSLILNTVEKGDILIYKRIEKLIYYKTGKSIIRYRGDLGHTSFLYNIEGNNLIFVDGNSVFHGEEGGIVTRTRSIDSLFKNTLEFSDGTKTIKHYTYYNFNRKNFKNDEEKLAAGYTLDVHVEYAAVLWGFIDVSALYNIKEKLFK